jgi:signal transduction histidine kinase
VPLSLACTVRKAIAGYAFAGDQLDRVELDLAQDFTVLGDENLLIYVLFNLLANALYHLQGRPDGAVRIGLVRDGARHLLLFSDNGPGIPPERIAGIFEAFTTDPDKPGTGLGLPFCKRVMSALGGQIAVRCGPGGGTELRLAFPAARREVPPDSGG